MLLPESSIFKIARKLLGSFAKTKLAKYLKQWLIFGRAGSMNVYHISLLKKNIRKGDVVLDVGANCGDYSALFLKLGATVYAFEPSTIFRKLYERFRGNKNIKCIYGAIGREEKDITLNEFIDSRFSTATGKLDGGEVIVSHKVPCRRLDTFHLSPNFIKIDVEGMDYEVLQGARETIKENRPKVLIEVNPAWLIERGHTVAEIKEFFFKLNYMAQEIKCYGEVTDILFIPLSYAFGRDRVSGKQERNQ